MISNVFKCRKCSEQMWKHCEAWTFTRTYKKDVKACCNSWCQCQSALRSGCAGQDTQRMTLFNLSTSKWSKLCFASITSIFAASSRRRPSTRTSCHSHSGVGTEKKKNLHISTLSYYPTMWNFRQSERGPGAGRVIIQPPSPRIDTQNHALHSEQCTICGISPGHWKNLENAHEISRDPTESIGDFADSVACCCLLLPVAACCLFILGHIAFLALSFKETEKSEPFIRKDPRELRRVLSPAATTLTLSNSPLGYPLPQGHEHHQAFCKKQPSWTFWYFYDCVARLANGIIGYNRHW